MVNFRLLLALVGALLSGGAHGASVLLDQDGPGGSTLLSEVYQWDWAPSSVMAIEGNRAFENFLNNSADGQGRPVNFFVVGHSRLSAFKDKGNKIISLPGLDVDFEYTMVYGFGEIVDTAAGSPNLVAIFGYDTQQPLSYFEVYYDANPNANELTGTGFNDGVLVLSGTIPNDTDGYGNPVFGSFSNSGSAPVALDQFQGNSAPWSVDPTVTVSGSGSNSSLNVRVRYVNFDFFKSTVDQYIIGNVSQGLAFTSADPSVSFVTTPGGSAPVLFGPDGVGRVNGGLGKASAVDSGIADWSAGIGGGAEHVMFMSDFNASISRLLVPPSIDIEKTTNGIDADDPEAGDAPQLLPGKLVSWIYVVTNNSNVTVEDVVVSDDQSVAVTCGKPSPIELAPGESMRCTASGAAEDLVSTSSTTVPGVCGSFDNSILYKNIGRVEATAVTGEFVEDEDPSHYCNPQEPSITIEKSTNGVDADDSSGIGVPLVAVGNPVVWTYMVTNTGNATLTNVSVVDDQVGDIFCDSDTLAPGHSMECTATAVAEDLGVTQAHTVLGQCGNFPDAVLYENVGSVVGFASDGTEVSDDDPSHYCNPQEPSINIEKATNGIDADIAGAGDAPQIAEGNAVEWSFRVTNTGNVSLSGVSVSDNQLGVVVCPEDGLDPGESMGCIAHGVAENLNTSTVVSIVIGRCGRFDVRPLYENLGRVEGVAPDLSVVADEDPSHYCNPQHPGIDIEKSTNGVDADDPNSGDAPKIAIDGEIIWRYVVTNTGNTPVDNLVVSDDQLGPVNCPKALLDPGESMECIVSGVADDLENTALKTVIGVCGSRPNSPLYQNLAEVTGIDPAGDVVSDQDRSHYCNTPPPAIEIQKATNGEDADFPTGPFVAQGDAVDWTYVVTNTGFVDLVNIVVVDSRGVDVDCPAASLVVGAAMTCTGSGFAGLGQYSNVGRVEAESPAGQSVNDEDPSHYFGSNPAIDIEKATNGEDADNSPGPFIAAGGNVYWTYVITNTGNVPLTDVVVSDDQSVAVICPATGLVVGASMTCTGSGTAASGQYANLGTVEGIDPSGKQVSDRDPSHYFGSSPLVDIEKHTNGQDADTLTGPEILVGEAVNWSYIVTNTGNVPLANLVVSDSRGVAVSCPADTLGVNASMTCTGNGIAELGQYANIGSVVGNGPSGRSVSDSDPSHYIGKAPALGALGDKVWNDLNGDGVQAASEPGVDGVKVNLFDSGGVLLGIRTTANGGMYLFDNLPAGNYVVEFVLPAGYAFTVQDAGNDDGADSDADTVTGRTASINLLAGETDLTWDAGLVMECSVCDGKITTMTLQYNGDQPANISVVQKKDGAEIFNALVAAGDSFSFIGSYSKGGKITLGTEISVFVDDGSGTCMDTGGSKSSKSSKDSKSSKGSKSSKDSKSSKSSKSSKGSGGDSSPADCVGGAVEYKIHTSCSDPNVAPGYVIGPLQVLAAESRDGGAICPVEPPPPASGDCEVCSGKITTMTLQYDGAQDANIWVLQNKDGAEIFNGLVAAGDSFSFIGTYSKGGKITLGTEISVFVADGSGIGGAVEYKIHTSCSDPNVAPGYVIGPLQVLAADSRTGGAICPVEPSGPGSEVCFECEGKVTELTLKYNGSQGSNILVVQSKDGAVVFDGFVESGGQFSVVGTWAQGGNVTLGTEISVSSAEGEIGIHTSCSKTIAIGSVFGNFEVIGGASRIGGPLPTLSDLEGGMCQSKDGKSSKSSKDSKSSKGS